MLSDQNITALSQICYAKHWISLDVYLFTWRLWKDFHLIVISLRSLAYLVMRLVLAITACRREFV